MKLHPRVTRSVVELVKRFEGLRRRSASLADGGWTIGYGHTRSAREGGVVSPEDADALLYYDLSEVAEKVEAWTFAPLNQNQFEALTAFAFNIGIDNFRRSTVLKRVNEGQHLMAAAALELWRKADFGGEDLVIDALVRRRAAEKAYYLTPPEGFRPSPTPVLRPTFDHSVIEAAAQSRMGRSAAVVDAPLDGDQAIATVEHHPDEDEARQTVFPYVAATGMATARLHQLFPKKAAEPKAGVPSLDSSFALEGDHHPSDQAAPKAVNDAPFGQLSPEIQAPPPQQESAPAPNFETAPVADFNGFTPPPVRQFDASKTPQVSVADRAPLFDAPSPRAHFVPSESAAAPRLRNDAPAQTQLHDYGHGAHHDAAAVIKGHEPGPPRDRSMIYSGVGLLGVILFAAALISMFSGKANPVNLLIGLTGIFLMTIIGGYFLLRFLNKRDGLSKL